MKLKLEKIRLKDLGVARHQLIPKKYEGKLVSISEATKKAEEIAKELGYKEVRYYQENENNFEFRFTSRNKKWAK